MSDASGLLLLHLLADREGRPGALRLQAATPTAVTLEALRPLCARLPCLVPADQRDAPSLIDSGARLLRDEQVVIAAPTAKVDAVVPWLGGDWYLQPPPAGSTQLSSSRALALKLMQLVASDADNHEIEAVFRQDPTLSYHLLRLVNSVAMGLKRQVTSFSQAIVLVGRQQLRRWLNFILFAARDDDPRSPMLLAHVAARARTLELLAQARGDDKAMQDEIFMTGM
ncbi:MAG TPA: HDOD domain-containing protein, partial [Arenimonas sp.]|nr:HDOD domain-containing protein [Arenimonas sp.]